MYGTSSHVIKNPLGSLAGRHASGLAVVKTGGVRAALSRRWGNYIVETTAYVIVSCTQLTKHANREHVPQRQQLARCMAGSILSENFPCLMHISCTWFEQSVPSPAN